MVANAVAADVTTTIASPVSVVDPISMTTGLLSDSICDVSCPAILDNGVVSDEAPRDNTILLPRGEFIDISVPILTTPCYEDIPCFSIYPDCVSGSCTCCHLIGGFPCDFKPCRAASVFFGPNKLDIPDTNRDYLWRGFVKGFSIVDDDCPASYLCQNYESITCDTFYDEMSELLREELAVGKVTVADSQPQCVHSLGAVTKSNGKLRPLQTAPVQTDLPSIIICPQLSIVSLTIPLKLQ